MAGGRRWRRWLVGRSGGPVPWCFPDAPTLSGTGAGGPADPGGPDDRDWPASLDPQPPEADREPS